MSQDHPEPDPASTDADDSESRCQRLQAAWAAWLERSDPQTTRPPLGDYLTGLQGEPRRRLLVALIRLDASSRRKLGEVPSIRDYLPVASNDLSAIEEALFLSAVHVVSNGPAPAGQSAGDASDEPAPQRIGRYVVRRRLGEGGFGTVYLGEDEGLARSVAIKEPRDYYLPDLNASLGWIS